MNSTDNRPVRTALIPWVVALVALLALNALAPDHSLARKSESSKGIGLSQLADSDQAPGRIFNPLLFLAPAPFAGTGFLNRSSLLLYSENRRDLPLMRCLEGAVQGRAPPASSLS
ncbi:MAG: hypothetical protein V4819_25800 [Verrucomicrobiota bacterium]